MSAAAESGAQAPVIAIGGPTASGKSALALRLARELGGTVVNADAMQVYRELRVLSARPDAADEAAAPHRLYGVLPASRRGSVGWWREAALAEIAAARAAGRVPIVVGGSGLYLKALTHGLDPLPPGDPTLRLHLASLSLEEKVAQLLALDPASAENVPLQNPRYVERALEICLLTGQPQSTLRTAATRPQPNVHGFCLTWPRESLHQRINDRVHLMINAGAITEIENAEPITGALLKAIGVREIQSHLRGEISLTDTISAIQQATRRYAKRQMTWFRREACFQTICLPDHPTPESLSAFIRASSHA
jgi:tRNA dimethylallyltransferase